MGIKVELKNKGNVNYNYKDDFELAEYYDFENGKSEGHIIGMMELQQIYNFFFEDFQNNGGVQKIIDILDFIKSCELVENMKFRPEESYEHNYNFRVTNYGKVFIYSGSIAAHIKNHSMMYEMALIKYEAGENYGLIQFSLHDNEEEYEHTKPIKIIADKINKK